jgi:anti-anti-sigma factor
MGMKWLTLKGRVDSIAAPDIQNEIKNLITGGQRTIVAHLEDVNYVSSAGLRVLISTQQQLKKVGGEIILYKTTENILELFKMSSFDKIFTILHTRDEIEALLATNAPSSETGAQEIDGIAYRFLKKTVDAGKLFVIGSQEKLPSAGYIQDDMITVKAKEIQFGAGLASLGDNYEECKQFFGESLVINRNFFFYPAVKRPAVDFMLCTQDDSHLEYQFLHGFGFNGEYSTILSFEGVDCFVDLNQLMKGLFEFSDADLLGIVMLAESKGFWGMHLKQVPIVENRPENGKDIFDTENFSAWVNFPVEPEAVNNIVAGVGIAVRDVASQCKEVQELIAKGGNFHLHGCLFEKEPLSKNVDQFQAELNRVMTQLEVYKVQHILGQSRFSSGLVGIVELE